jgi:hypothetical protein
LKARSRKKNQKHPPSPEPGGVALDFSSGFWLLVSGLSSRLASGFRFLTSPFLLASGFWLLALSPPSPLANKKTGLSACFPLTS